MTRARLEAAVKFLQFISTPEAGTLWVNNVGELPAQLSAASDEMILADPILGPLLGGTGLLACHFLCR